MRLLSIGRPLPDMTIDNHTIFNAPACFDYEAIAIDPEGVFGSIRELLDASQEHATHGDSRVVNALTGPGVAAGEILQRRRDELVRALERGALVAVFTHPQAMITEIAGFPGLDRYFFLPAPAGLAWDAGLIRWGEGVQAAVADPSAPLRALCRRRRQRHALPRALQRLGARLRKARERVRPIGRRRARGRRVPRARRDGRLPAGSAHPRRRRRAQAGRGDPRRRPRAAGPTGRRSARLAAPAGPGGPRGARGGERRGGERPARAEAQREATAGELAQLARVRDVLWTEGNHALMPAVVRCLELLGFRTSERDGQVTLSDAAGRLELEAEGSTEAIGMAPHYRLRARLDKRIEQEGRAARGLVVANGERTQPPDRRDAPIADALRVAAEATSYAVLPSPELFAAASAALEGLDDETLASLRARLVEHDGVVSLGDLLGATEPEDAAAVPMTRPLASLPPHPLGEGWDEGDSGRRSALRSPLPWRERVRVRGTPRPIAYRLRGAAPPTPPSRTSTLRGSGPPTHPRISFLWGLRPHAPTRIGSRNTAPRAHPPIPSPLAGDGAGAPSDPLSREGERAPERPRNGSYAKVSSGRELG